MQGFLGLTPLNRRTVLLLAVASFLSVGVYLLVSALNFRIGFPLDDSWIHLTYARNLAEYGEWAFQPGKPSAGSTAPLWTALLSIGFFLHLAPYIWTYFLGAVTIWAMAMLGETIVRTISPEYKSNIPWIGLFIAAEWHLVWSAASGMETLLHALIVTAVLGALMTGSRRFMTLGLLTGLSVWVRPDGLTLVGPVVVYALAGSRSGAERYRSLFMYFLGVASLFVPYMLFNLVLAGTPMPNTFYAKQAEYVAWQARPFVYRLGQLSVQYMIGPSVALFPGVIAWVVISFRKRDWGTLAGMVWFMGYLFIYIERLPVYQHGRYVMPTMPVFFLWGLAAWILFLRSGKFGRYQWVTSTAGRLFVAFLSLGFWLMGAFTYAEDVAIIESEMVSIAKWVAVNIPEDAIIAAHDIGALGYFDRHELIDLAGLVSPEVIPVIRDEPGLANFLDENNVSYLIAFPDFYPMLDEMATPVFSTESPFTLQLGQENMVVYHWR